MMNRWMKKSQKKKIDVMLGLLDKACDAFKKAVETGNVEIAISLLEQCQDFVIQVGNIIEESLGENFVTVKLLENYCEQIYQAYELIRQNCPVNANKMHKNLRKELICIENSVKNDIQVKTTAVFLPYKASMWDSLESVWKAADEDPNCDAYVVPIPYFDKNPDGSFREMHYEGNEYPKYVPITSWETYDVETEHPDMIFIHNPYDEFNHVTSVLPMYYSKKLKADTDLLVYIPYYILGEINPNNKESVENMQHFCTVPAVIYADKVIVQSKEWRQVYIDVMTQMMGKDTRQVWQNKILALGSPKIDRIHTIGRDDVEIPLEWRKVIEKPDGSWKKIFFYNTSVSALLQHDEKMLKKMEYVFRVFQENKDEIALLWRPHPLIKATIESMRPELWTEYEKIVKTYREEGWGIYDDTVDINRAIALSDAYYGDPSSVVKMCKETGMPVMIQNVEVLGDNWEEESASGDGRFYSHITFDNRLWFVSLDLTLRNMDVKTGRISYVDCDGEETENQYLVSDRMLIYEGCIYWIDIYRQYIHEYNIKTNKCQNYQVLEIEGADIKNAFFVGIYIYKGSIYFCLRESPYIVKFDLANKKWEPCLHQHAEGRSINVEGWSGRCSAQVDTAVYIFGQSSKVMKINLDDFQREYISISEEISDVINAIYKNNRFYIRTIDGDVYIWNETEGCIRKVFRGKNAKYPYSTMAVTEHKLFLLPVETGRILSVDLDNDACIEQIDYPEDLQYSDCPDSKYGSSNTEDADYIWFDNRRANYILRINKKSECAEWIKPKPPFLREEWYHQEKKGNLPSYYKNVDYLEGFLKMEEEENIDVGSSKNIGLQIWNALEDV